LIGRIFFLVKLAKDKFCAYLFSFEFVTIYCHCAFVILAFLGGSGFLRPVFNGNMGVVAISYFG